MSQKIKIRYKTVEFISPDAVAVKFKDEYQAQDVLKFIAEQGVLVWVRYDIEPGGQTRRINVNTQPESLGMDVHPGQWLVFDLRTKKFACRTWDYISQHDWEDA